MSKKTDSLRICRLPAAIRGCGISSWGRKSSTDGLITSVTEFHVNYINLVTLVLQITDVIIENSLDSGSQRGLTSKRSEESGTESGIESDPSTSPETRS